MRLIDADALIDRLDYCVKEGMGSTIAFTFKHMVEDTPTIDAESVVRCKDCKYMSKGEEYLWCDHKQGMDLVDANDFCSYGEREGE